MLSCPADTANEACSVCRLCGGQEDKVTFLGGTLNRTSYEVRLGQIRWGHKRKLAQEIEDRLFRTGKSVCVLVNQRSVVVKVVFSSKLEMAWKPGFYKVNQ